MDNRRGLAAAGFWRQIGGPRGIVRGWGRNEAHQPTEPPAVLVPRVGAKSATTGALRAAVFFDTSYDDPRHGTALALVWEQSTHLGVLHSETCCRIDANGCILGFKLISNS